MVKKMEDGWDRVELTALYNGQPGKRNRWEKLVTMKLVERWQGEKPPGQKGHPPVIYKVTKAGAAKIKMPYEDAKTFSTLQFPKQETASPSDHKVEIRSADDTEEPTTHHESESVDSDAPTPAISDAEFETACRAYLQTVAPTWTEKFKATIRFGKLPISEIPDFVQKKFPNDISRMRKCMFAIEENIAYDYCRGVDPFR